MTHADRIPRYQRLYCISECLFKDSYHKNLWSRMHSHHSHSGQYCTHATGDLEACILEAIRQKFTLFCLTEHVPRYRDSDLYPGEKLQSGDSATVINLLALFADFHAHARQLQRKYAGQIEIFVGCESEFIREIDLRILELLVAKYPIDMMVGSVHHVNSIPIDFDQETWHEAMSSCEGEEDFYGRYFDHQYRVLTLFQPLVVGHFDVILLFAPHDTDLTRHSSVLSKIQRNIDFVVSYHGLFELNSAAFRKGWKSAYPSPQIVRMIQASGGAFCVSDDSHGPHQIGLNYKPLKDYMIQMGITRLGRLKTATAVQERTIQSLQSERVHAEVEIGEKHLQDFFNWQHQTE